MKEIKISCQGAGLASLDDLIIIQGNFKTLSKSSAEKLKNSILQEGFADPIRIWTSGGNMKKHNIIDGTQRIIVLKQMRDDGYKIPALPVDYIEAKSRKEAIRKIIALSSQFGDISIVGLDELMAAGGIKYVDIESFEQLTDGKRIKWSGPKGETEDDDEYSIKNIKAVVSDGDRIEINGHIVVCGDSTDGGSYPSGGVDLVFTSPPYNVGLKYEGTNDNLTKAQYLEMVAAVVGLCKGSMEQGRALAWNIGVSPKTYHGDQYNVIGSIGMEFYRQYVWKKAGVPVPSFYRTENKAVARNIHSNYTHEMVLIFSNGAMDHGGGININFKLQHDVFEIGKAGSTVDIPAGDSVSGDSNLDTRAAKGHPAVFPVELPEVFIQNYTAKGETVLDPFIGTGSTLIASEKLGRKCIGIEKSPRYCDILISRVVRWYRKNDISVKVKLNGKAYSA